MNVQEMYHDFRAQYSALSIAVDARHLVVWGSVDDTTAFMWFESLANVLNTRMGDVSQHAEIGAVLAYFEKALRTGDAGVKKCIEVSFVETLFWQVSRENSAPVWALLPKSLQGLFVDFHGRSPVAG